MRKLEKDPIPNILKISAEDWLTAWLSDKENSTKRYRYRSPEIKKALREETAWKCVYCESKIGDTSPGDVEHKIPSSSCPNLHFAWENLTVACTECNRRKNDYYNEDNHFIDPYCDDVESMLLHEGPLVYSRPAEQRSETAVQILQFNHEKRIQLILRKIEALESIKDIIERATKETSPILKKLHIARLKDRCEKNSEYSAMIKAFVTRNYADPETLLI